MHATDGQHFSNISADTTAFGLVGGLYVIVAIAGSWSAGSVQLQALAGDGSTWVNVGTAFTANGVDGYEMLPTGQYKFAVASATGVYVTIISIPSQ